ncbi:dTDP-4-dehydrorhamnose reductase, partial [Acidithiobacillus ferrooxidans]|nr:dTDP-4-dehydrorhamnose reductase [Acidithiobacillus ferrooxidans]
AILDKTASYTALGAAPHWRTALRRMLTEPEVI